MPLCWRYSPARLGGCGSRYVWFCVMSPGLCCWELVSTPLLFIWTSAELRVTQLLSQLIPVMRIWTHTYVHMHINTHPWPQLDGGSRKMGSFTSFGSGKQWEPAVVAGFSFSCVFIKSGGGAQTETHCFLYWNGLTPQVICSLTYFYSNQQNNLPDPEASNASISYCFIYSSHCS